VDVPATAVELPVSVSVHTAAPAEVIAAALHVAVKPLGSPEATLMLDPDAAAGMATPPAGVAVNVTIAEESDATETEVGAADNCTPAAACTCKVTFWVEVSPSPAAVITTVAFPTVAVAEAVSVSVSPLVFALKDGVSGFADHPAVTPAGRPLIVKLMLPL
jgi:hypothetical protein